MDMRPLLQGILIFALLLSGFAVAQTEIKTLASDAQGGDRFGRASVRGDVAIISAYEEDEGGTRAGAAYIFHRDSGGPNSWGEIKKLVASDAQSTDQLGRYQVSIDGSRAILGAVGEDAAGSNAGAAYIFHRDSGGANNWGEVKKITASDGQNGDFFGSGVSIDGDYAVIGANGANGIDGVAYIFSRNLGGIDNWGEIKKIIGSDVTTNDRFGSVVSISGDYAIVGALGGGIGGHAYIFARNAGGTDNWGEIKKLVASDTESGDRFGTSVAIDGDYLIVGAPNEDDGGSIAGAAYIFARNEGGTDNWGEVKRLKAADPQAADYFGIRVAISGDNVIVGANEEDEGGDNAGAAYVFSRHEGGTNNWGQLSKIIASDSESDDAFGGSVAISNGDIIVGALLEDEAGSAAGAAYIYPNFITDISDSFTDKIPSVFSVSPNYPNPFNPSTTIKYYLSYSADVTITVFDLLGRNVKTLVSERQTPGEKEVSWDGRDYLGEQASSGVYFYQFKAGEFIKTHKMLLVR